MKKKGVFAALAAVFLGFCTAMYLCIGALSAPQAVFGETSTQITVALDAGHGGVDGGVTGKKTKVKESDLNLQITMQLGETLEEMGFQVVYTRKTQANYTRKQPRFGGVYPPKFFPYGEYARRASFLC